MGGNVDLWKAVITSYHLSPAHQRRLAKGRNFLPLLILSDLTLELYILLIERWAWKYLCFLVKQADILCLGLWVLVSAWQYTSLVDLAINECKNWRSSASKKGMTTWPEEGDQGTEHLPCPWKSPNFTKQLFNWPDASIRKESSPRKDSQKKKKAKERE